MAVPMYKHEWRTKNLRKQVLEKKTDVIVLNTVRGL